MDTVALKKDAREKLKGNYIEIAAAFMIFVVLLFGAIIIENIVKNTSIIIIILISFIVPGLITMATKIADGEETNLDDLFSKMNMFLKVICITILCTIMIGLFALFLIVSLYGLYTSSSLWGIYSDYIVITMMCIGIILSVSLLVLTSYTFLSFSLVYFVLNDNPEMKIMDIIRKSYLMMDGHKLELFVLLISFTGWLLLGLVTLGVLYFWIFPYVLVTLANFYNSLLPRKKRKKVKQKLI